MSTPGQPGTSVTSAVVPTDSLGHNIPNLIPVAFAPDGVIFQPGGTFPNAAPWGGNRGNTFALVCGVAKAGHGMRVRVDSSISTTLPAGTYDFGAGCTLEGLGLGSELDADDGVVFTRVPDAIVGLTITGSSDDTPLWTIDGGGNQRLILEGVGLSSGGDAPVFRVDAGQVDLFASGLNTFFDSGAFVVGDGATMNVHLSAGASWADGAFVVEGGGQIFLFFEDSQSIEQAVENGPLDLSPFVNLTNESGVSSLAFDGSTLAFNLAANQGDAFGPWTIGFPQSSADLVSFDFVAASPNTGTWIGVAAVPVTLSTADGVAIKPPPWLTLENIAINSGATDVSLFTPTAATRFSLRGSSWVADADKAPILHVSSGLSPVVELFDASVLAGSGAAILLDDGSGITVECWDGAVIGANSIALPGGEGETASLSILVRGDGCVLAPSYGAAITLFPGVLFAAIGDPVTVGVTPTDVGCLYLDSGSGIEWTYDGVVWKQVNPAIVTTAIPLANLQAAGPATTLAVDLTGILPANTKVSLCEIQVGTALAALGLVGVAITMQSNAGDVDGSLASVGSGASIPAAGFYTGGSNPYPSREGISITAQIVLTGAQFADLAAGDLTFRLLKQVLPYG